MRSFPPPTGSFPPRRAPSSLPPPRPRGVPRIQGRRSSGCPPPGPPPPPPGRTGQGYPPRSLSYPPAPPGGVAPAPAPPATTTRFFSDRLARYTASSAALIRVSILTPCSG